MGYGHRSDDETPEQNRVQRTAVGIVVVLLALGLSTALNLITFAALWAAKFSPDTQFSGLSENATQVLTAWGSGIIGVIGSFIGYSYGLRRPKNGPMLDDEPPPPPPPGG